MPFEAFEAFPSFLLGGIARLQYPKYIIISPVSIPVSNDLLKEVEEAGVGVQLCKDRSMTGMLFADDFVGISDSRENLQKLIDVAL